MSSFLDNECKFVFKNMDVRNFHNCEVENESLFNLEMSDKEWIYTIHTHKFYALYNFTILFRGQEDEILDELLYSVITINGYCVDILSPEKDDEDPRVRDFNGFRSHSSLPCYAQNITKIIIGFKNKHNYSFDKIRVIADAVLKEDIYTCPDLKFETKIANLEVKKEYLNTEKSLIITSGEKWTTDFVNTILDDEINFSYLKSCDDDIELSEEEIYKKDINFLNETSMFYKRLDDFIAWRTQNKRLRKQLELAEINKI